MTCTIATAQYPITAHKSFEAWKRHSSHWVAEAAAQKAQLLLFPEYGAMELVSLLPETDQRDLRGQVRLLEQFRSDCWEVFAQLAKTWQLILVAPSFPVLEGGKTYNRAAVFSPKGLVGYQDKFFMTRFENEDWGIDAAPAQLKVFEADWGSFGIQICYDVEFPLGAHQLCRYGASLILAPSCTETIRGATRVHVGARARALENQCYVAVSQTVGDAPWSLAVDINYGYAAVYSTPDANLPEEGIVAIQPPQQPGWLVQTLDFSKTEAVRADGQVFNFKDGMGLVYGVEKEPVEVLRVWC
jgi:predicted amidohydrolase